jgi:1-deoxy-D-xylulose-5-phosphate reductoisomerase
MKKKIAILGSTGSIGKTLIKIINKDYKNFEVLLLTANKDYSTLFKQAKKFNVKNLIITDSRSYEILKKKCKRLNIKVFNDFKILDKIFKKKIDYVMSSISGLEGLVPTFKIIRYTKNIAIANKEAIICGWNLIKKELLKNNTEFIPVDSEHFSVWYGLRNNKDLIERIYLTASGGPFFKLPLTEFKNIKLQDALNHPNWKMGKKISIDSATMMNKVFEIIEAKNIFNLNYNELSILTHPQSFVHTIIKFKNGLIKIIAHKTSMEIPIFNTLYSNSKTLKTNELDIKYINNLEFFKLDVGKYPVVKILNNLPNKSSLFETIIVSANDQLVDLYLRNKISFTKISHTILKIIKLREFLKYKKKYPKSVQEIINLSTYVRLKVKSICI